MLSIFLDIVYLVQTKYIEHYAFNYAKQPVENCKLRARFVI